MKRFATGAVCGKFWPLHLGHANLIRTAVEQCECVYVFVIYQPNQRPSGFLRAKWVQEAFPYPQTIVQPILDLPRYEDNREWALAFQNQLSGMFGRNPGFDAVFTNESWGEDWAWAAGAVHVSTDPNREQFPISARQIRAEPQKYVEWIHPVARSYYEELLRRDE